ncbi:MAG TPA: carbohydrate binding domain-containing protein [Bacilli bacterium]|nr:carbohydrate binding domain-containing protein [Bacilli bacterium]
MKKLVYFAALILAATTLAGCGSSLNPSDGSENPNSNSVSSEPIGGIVWEGTEDAVVQLGDEFDLLDGVKAIDPLDGELEVTIYDDDYFSFNYVSSYTIKYRATNSRSQMSEELRTIQVVKGVNVDNGAFALGKAYWKFDRPGGNGTFSVINEEAVISITDAGTEAWAVQLYQTGLQFTGGKTYELSFKAKSVYGRSVSAGFENVSNNYSMMVSGYQAVKLTSEWSIYSVLCTPTADVGFVKAVLYLGQNLEIDSEASVSNPIDITIDDIRVKEVTMAIPGREPVFSNADTATVATKEAFDALPPVTAVDYQGANITSSIITIGQVPNSVNAQTGMMVSYRVTDSQGNFGFVNRRVNFVLARDNPYNLINDEFLNGYQGWIKDVNQTNGTGAATFTEDTVKGEVYIDITNGSSDNWHIQLWQGAVQLTAGKVYRTTIRAKASVERNMTIEISNPAASFAKLATDLVRLTTDYQTFVLEFVAQTNASAKFSLLLGGQGNNLVTVDSFKNTEIDASEATTIDLRSYEPYEAINGDFKYGYYGWSKEATNGSVVNFNTDQANEQVLLDIVTPTGTNWHAQLSQDGKTFTTGVSYKLVFTASASIATPVFLEASNNNGATVLAREEVTITTSMATYEVQFSPSETFTLGKIAVLLGACEVSVITLTTFQVVIIPS